MAHVADDKPKSRLAARWASVAAVLTAIVLVIDFLTSSIGLFEKLKALLVEESSPVVVMKEVEFENSSSCLEFAFSGLPLDFGLGDIGLTVIDAEGPDEIQGDMASSVLEKKVNFIVKPADLVREGAKFEVRAGVQSTKADDAFYLHVCPTLSRPGTKGTITVVPTFLNLAGEAVNETLDVRTAAGTPLSDGIRLLLVRPKNERVTETEDLRGVLPK